MMKRILIGLSLFCVVAKAVDVPGALTQTGEALPNYAYEVLLSPSYLIEPRGAYMSAEMRYQVNEDFGTGVSFGAGEVGWKAGATGTFFIVPDVGVQPAFAVIGGLFLNRVQPYEYFVVKAVPTISKMFKADWGRVTPYAGWHIAPSFRLGPPANEFSSKVSVGSEFSIKGMAGLRLWTEANISIVNADHALSLGISYPFTAL